MQGGPKVAYRTRTPGNLWTPDWYKLSTFLTSFGLGGLLAIKWSLRPAQPKGQKRH